MAMNDAPLSIIIPTLNAATPLGACLAALEPGRSSGLVREIIVADGGSSDGTAEIAAAHGARVLTAATGRGPQMIAGAAAAQAGGAFLFLHADTALSPNWAAAARQFLAARQTGEVRPVVGVFRLKFECGGWRGAVIAESAMIRTRLFRLPYGDQGLLIARETYQALGGFRPLPLFEDVDFIDRIKAEGGAVRVLRADAATSPARYERAGYAARVIRNARCYRAYRRGAPIAEIAALYRE